MWEQFYFHFQWNVGLLKSDKGKIFIILVTFTFSEDICLFWSEKLVWLLWVLIETASLYKWTKMHHHAGFSYGLNIFILIQYTCIVCYRFKKCKEFIGEFSYYRAQIRGISL